MEAKRRGRPPVIQQTQQESKPMTEVRRERPKRPSRSHISKGPLTSVARPGYRNYYANMEDGNIEALMEMGYTPVINPNADTSKTAGGVESKYGNVITKSVGGGVKAMLMEIPLEWYEEDYAEQQKIVDRSDSALNVNETGQYGSVTIDRK